MINHLYDWRDFNPDYILSLMSLKSFMICSLSFYDSALWIIFVLLLIITVDISLKSSVIPDWVSS